MPGGRVNGGVITSLVDKKLYLEAKVDTTIGFPTSPPRSNLEIRIGPTNYKVSVGDTLTWNGRDLWWWAPDGNAHQLFLVGIYGGHAGKL